MKNYLKKVVLFTYQNVDFRLSLAADDVHQETCLYHCRGISSDDVKNETVQEEREESDVKNAICSLRNV
jgi:hypothetical protein